MKPSNIFIEWSPDPDVNQTYRNQCLLKVKMQIFILNVSTSISEEGREGGFFFFIAELCSAKRMQSESG